MDNKAGVGEGFVTHKNGHLSNTTVCIVLIIFPSHNSAALAAAYSLNTESCYVATGLSS